MRNLLPLPIPDTFRNLVQQAVPRKAALFSLVLVLFFTGVYTEQIYAWLDRFYQFLFSSFGIFSFLNRSQAEVSSQITMRSWPTMLTYGLMYTSLSFATLHVYFNNFYKTKITAAFYAAIFLLCVFLISMGKLIPEFVWAYKLCRRIIELVISPFPVVLLLAVFAGFKRK